MSQTIEINGIISDQEHGKRLDQALSILFPDYSRSRLKEWILEKRVKVDGEFVTLPKQQVQEGQEIEIIAEVINDEHYEPQDIPLDIVYSDEHILIINKPAGLVVHPGAGCYDGTLLNGLLYHFPQTMEVPRAGIVHRLDKDTSGLMVVALDIESQNKLVKAISKHNVVREYEAVVCGHMTAGGVVDKPIGGHPRIRTNMAVMPEGLGKPAVTHYRVLEKFRAHTRLRLRLETGRTHQIRVHMAHINHPLVGDQQYGDRSRLIKQATPEFSSYMAKFPRQALHAVKLELEHPITGEYLSFESPIPDDIEDLLVKLREDTALHPNDIVWN